MKVCLPLFLLLLAWLPLGADPLTEIRPFLGLTWGLDQHEVEKILEKNDDVLPHGGYLILHAGVDEYYCRRYGTYLIASVPMELLCGFDRDYTELQMILLRYRANNFNRAQSVYTTLADLFTERFFGADSERDLRSRERRPSRQDLSVSWVFGNTRFHMRAWGSDANGEVSVWFSQMEKPAAGGTGR